MSKDLERIIKIVFKGDNETDKAFKSVERNIGNMAGSVERATAPIADLSTNLAKTEAALIAMGIAAGIFAFGKARDLQSAMIDLEKVAGNQPEALAQAKAAAYSLADTYGESTTSVLASIAGFKQAGFELDEAAQLTRDALNLMIAGDVETDVAQSYIVRILKGFSEEASEASRAVDILNEISNNYATNVQELASGMATLAPIADTVGLSMEQTAGLLTPIIEVFQSGEEAARGLRTGLLRLADPTPEIIRQLESLGVAVKNSNGEQRNAYDILNDVSVAYQTMSSEQKLTTAAILAGKDQAAKMVKVFDNLNGVTEVTATAMKSAGSAMAEVEKRLESAEVATNRFFVAVENTFAKAGDKYIDSATGMINASTEVAQAIQGSIDDGTFDPVFDAINKAFKNAEDLLKDVAKNLPEALEGVDFSGAIDAMEDLGDRATKAIESILGGEVDLSTAEGVQDAIQKFVDLFEGLTRFTEGFLEGFDPVLKAIGQFGTMAAESAEKGKELGQIGGLFKTFNIAATAVAALNSALFAFVAVTGVKGAITGINSKLSLLPGTITTVIGSAAKKTGLLGLAAVAGYGAGTAIEKTNFLWVNDLSQGVLELTDKIVDFSDTQKYAEVETKALDKAVQAYIDNIWKFEHPLDDLRTKLKELGYEIDEASDRELVLQVAHSEGLLDIDYLQGIGRTRIEELQKTIDENPVVIEADTRTIEEKLTDLGYDLSQIPEEKLVQIKAAADIAEAQILLGGLESKTYNAEIDVKLKEPEKLEYFEEIDGKLIRFEIDADTTTAATKIEDAKKEAETPLELKIEMEKADLERDLANIKANAEVVQSSMEWKAKMDIAEIEANSAKVESIMSSVGESVSTAGDVLGDIFGNVSDLKDAGFWNLDIKKWIEEQTDIQRRGLELQESMADVEKRYMEEKIKAMQRGEALIKIEGDGLQPHLEAFMWEILEAIQVRVAEEGLDMLLGAGS
jgi:TP901 family phage tail tape measure protein